MRRIHLFELEDQAWLPRVVRDAATGYLRLVARLTGQPRRLLPVLRDALRRSGTRRIVDLCSGGGGSLVAMVPDLEAEGLDVRICLTDLYPNCPALERVARLSADRIEFVADPVDARAVPRRLAGLRTLFNGLHHFCPEDARAVLADAVRAREPIVACEIVRRHPLAILLILMTPLLVLLLVPFLRPFDWRWLPLTYLIPVIPLVVVWDGVVSCLRAYTLDELRALADAIDAPDYCWEIGQVSLGIPALPATYLVGIEDRSASPLKRPS